MSVGRSSGRAGGVAVKRPIEHLRLLSGIIGGLSERRIGNIGRFEMKWGDLTKEAHT